MKLFSLIILLIIVSCTKEPLCPCNNSFYLHYKNPNGGFVTLYIDGLGYPIFGTMKHTFIVPVDYQDIRVIKHTVDSVYSFIMTARPNACADYNLFISPKIQKGKS